MKITTNSLINLKIEMTSRMNIVESMNGNHDQHDIDRISEIATILSALAPHMLDPRFK